MMIFYLRLAPLSDKRDGVIEILRSVIDLTRGKSGCLSCASFEAHDTRGSILYLEQWETPEDLHRHIQSNHYRRIISAMELAREAPEIRFYEVLDSAGIELIEKLRAVPANENERS